MVFVVHPKGMSVEELRPGPEGDTEEHPVRDFLEDAAKFWEWPLWEWPIWIPLLAALAGAVVSAWYNTQRARKDRLLSARVRQFEAVRDFAIFVENTYERANNGTLGNDSPHPPHDIPAVFAYFLKEVFTERQRVELYVIDHHVRHAFDEMDALHARAPEAAKIYHAGPGEDLSTALSDDRLMLALTQSARQCARQAQQMLTGDLGLKQPRSTARKKTRKKNTSSPRR